jgi:type I restriction enzyme S subunit
MKCMGLDHLNTDAVVPGLNRENAYRQPVVIPADGLLATWDALAGSFRAGISHNNVQIEKLAQLRDTLLPRLISGKLRFPKVEVLVEAPISIEIAV